jgi:hypothetical protein
MPASIGSNQVQSNSQRPSTQPIENTTDPKAQALGRKTAMVMATTGLAIAALGAGICFTPAAPTGPLIIALGLALMIAGGVVYKSPASAVANTSPFNGLNNDTFVPPSHYYDNCEHSSPDNNHNNC